MSRGLVAEVVMLVFTAAGRQTSISDGVIATWAVLLDDIEDRADVLPLVRRLALEREVVTPKDVRDAILAERRSKRPVAAVAGVLEDVDDESGAPRCPYCGQGPGAVACEESARHWFGVIRGQLAEARGPLAQSLGESLRETRTNEEVP